MDPNQPRRGYEGMLLLSVDDNSAANPVLSLFDGSNHASAVFLKIKGVTDEDHNFSAEKADTTDKEAVEAGFTTEIVIASTGEASFTLFNKPGNPFVGIILDAWANRTQLPIWAPDANPEDASTTNPVQGLLANFSVEARKSRPVRGVQTWQISLSASSQPRWYKIESPLTAGSVA